MTRPTRFAALVFTSAFVLGSCGDSATDTAAGTVTDTVAGTSVAGTVSTSDADTVSTSEVATGTDGSSETAGPTVTVSSSPSSGCTTGDTDIPVNATRGPVVDVDGDGRPDTAWIAIADDGTVNVGIVTAAGGAAVRRFESASPVTRSVLVVDADLRPPVEILASTGRSVQLWAFQQCAIVDITNVQGKPYEFSLGFTDIGTGVGCVSIDGHQQLVGLDAKENGDTVDWSRTVVALEGTHARNAATSTGTFTRPGDDQKIELLHQVTCGRMTMATDGLTAAP